MTDGIFFPFQGNRDEPGRLPGERRFLDVTAAVAVSTAPVPAAFAAARAPQERCDRGGAGCRRSRRTAGPALRARDLVLPGAVLHRGPRGARHRRRAGGPPGGAGARRASASAVGTGERALRTG